MLRICRSDGCTTLTLGERCVLHEQQRLDRNLPRGRPFLPEELADPPAETSRTPPPVPSDASVVGAIGT